MEARNPRTENSNEIFELYRERTKYIISHEELINEVNYRKRSIDSLVSLKGVKKPICEDGILRRGEFEYKKDETGNGYWTRRYSGHEDVDYNNSKVRFLVVTKDSNEGVEEDEDTTNLGTEWDIRTETLRCNQSLKICVKATFAKTYMRLISMLVFYHSLNNNEIYEVLNDIDMCRTIWEKAPIARINLKKQPGKGSIKDVLLTSYIALYKDVLRKQVRHLKPTVIINSAGKPGMKFFKDMYSLECIDETYDERREKWLYYDKAEKLIVIDIYHLSCCLWNKRDLFYYKELVNRLDYIYEIINLGENSYEFGK